MSTGQGNGIGALGELRHNGGSREPYWFHCQRPSSCKEVSPQTPLSSTNPSSYTATPRRMIHRHAAAGGYVRPASAEVSLSCRSSTLTINLYHGTDGVMKILIYCTDLTPYFSATVGYDIHTGNPSCSIHAGSLWIVIKSERLRFRYLVEPYTSLSLM
ncbi:hypothetical protein EYF80_047780 [Liparis tanakae]|uniref:Uncharacterized protein n=1 Tax=Liparis tanakae TaxID=230148 RepID=A0A4Z2FLD4_9TELE|nr:hypothetical protein EYF80_047780 [Liparis tanakae]